MPRKTNSRAANGNGSIRKVNKTKNGKEYTYWEGRYTAGFDPATGKQIQRTISGKTQKEVAQKMRQIIAEIDAGTYIMETNITVKQWLEKWQKNYLYDVKPSTAYLYKREIELHIIPNIGEVKLKDLTPPMVQSLYNSLYKPEDESKKPLSAKSIKTTHGVLHKAIQQAIACNMIRSNPTNGTVLPKVEKKQIKPMDENQIAAFLKAIQGHPHEYLYKITLFTGLRQGEILGLPWDCVDFQNSTLTIKQQLRREQEKGGKYYLSSTKNGKVRVLQMPPSVLEMFRLQQIAQADKKLRAGSLWEDNGLVFTNETGGYLSYRTVYDCFKRVVSKIGIPDVRFHDLRHSYAVAAIQSGDDIKTVQENLGHATAAFTLDVYGHVTTQMKKASASRMEQFIQLVS